jgi:hypothetical protein
MASYTVLHIGGVIVDGISSLRAKPKVNLAHFNNRRHCQRGWGNIYGAINTLSEAGCSFPVLVEPPIGQHPWWRSCETNAHKVRDLELCSCDIPPSEFFDISCEHALRCFHLSTSTKSYFTEGENVSSD